MAYDLVVVVSAEDRKVCESVYGCKLPYLTASDLSHPHRTLQCDDELPCSVRLGLLKGVNMEPGLL